MTRRPVQAYARVRGWILALILLFTPVAGAAQQEHDGHQVPAQPESTRWQWHTDASVFFGLNHQERRFRDFTVWEAQNWLMASGERALNTSRLRVSTMWSFEPFTLEDIGSPQVFQTGETFQGGALIDFQHPHDLIMGLGADLRVPLGAVALTLGGDMVGSPTLGPPVFMHRPSAAFNPQAPLSHHHLDATHITPGVVRGALQAREWTFEGSWFRGREPDENRTDIDLGALDSYAARVSWNSNGWSAQVSAGWLTLPEVVTPFDATRVTASLAYTRAGLSWLAAFGQNREIHGNLEAYLFEASWRARPRDIVYTRLESVAKDILDVGFHPVGTFHPHRQSQIGAGTIGYVREILQSRAGAFGLGGDITGYLVPDNLREGYGSPLSFHAFVRYRLRTGDAPHVH
jgi:hypothetical protein